MLVHRITRTLPKRLPLFYQCISELRTVFRVDGDIGKNRKCNTPGVLELKLSAFTQRWESAADSAGTAIFQETKKSSRNLLKHIKTGCLSGIPPGGGTTKNERIHQHIKNFFRRSKVGIPLAYALLSIICYRHNSETISKFQKHVKPILPNNFDKNCACKNHHTSVGISSKVHTTIASKDVVWEIDLPDKEMDMELLSCY